MRKSSARASARKVNTVKKALKEGTYQVAPRAVAARIISTIFPSLAIISER